MTLGPWTNEYACRRCTSYVEAAPNLTFFNYKFRPLTQLSSFFAHTLFLKHYHHSALASGKDRAKATRQKGFALCHFICSGLLPTCHPANVRFHKITMICGNSVVMKSGNYTRCSGKR